MERINFAAMEAEASAVEARIRKAPQLVVEYLRLAKILEESGDYAGAEDALRNAQFLLPNAPAILEGIMRLRRWVEPSWNTAAVSTPEPPSQPEIDDVEPLSEVVVQPMEDDLDALIEGLGKARLGQNHDVAAPVENEWIEDDGLLTTETLAQIYVAQKQYEAALGVYERLVAKEPDPEKATELRQKANALREKLRNSE